IVGFALAAEGLAGSLAAAHWQPGLTGLPWLVGLAVALGFVFTRWGGLNSFNFWIFWLFGLAVGLLVATRLPGSGFLPSRLAWQQQVYTVLARLSDWVGTSRAGRVVQDDVLIALAIACFVYFWVYLCYLLALRLRMAWLGSGLLGAALFANVLFKAEAGGDWLVLWAGGSLLMILSVSLYRRELFYRQMAFFGWHQGRWVALGGGLLMAGISTAVFTFAPSAPFNEKLNELYNKINGPIGQARRVYEQIGVPQEYSANQIRGDSFQAQLAFLGPFRPGTDLVMKVKSDQPRYEQGVVFDRYDHNGWTNTKFNQFETNTTEYSTLTAAQQTARDRERAQIAQDITMVKPAGALLFAAPQPLGASVALKGDGLGDLRATTTIRPNQVYTSASLESTATAESLAAATGPIPADIRDAYLQLPADMPARIKQLAQQQTAGKASAFDKATALEAFIRTFPYDTEVPPPPSGRDGVDWFLFDERRGYCDYDSSAMAVMLRTLGIPARVAAGYSSGQLDFTDGLYHITEKDTHTWTQAYIAGYGWIDFEPAPVDPPFPRMHSPQRSPTPAAQPQPTPQPNATPTAGAGPGPVSGANSGGSSEQSPFPWWIILVVLALAGVAAYFYSRLRGPPGARLAYMRIALLGTLVGLRPRNWQTPQEYGRALHLRRGFDAGAVGTITSLYSAARYSGQPLDARANRRAWTAWQYLKSRLLRPWLRR
ncbi:MAG TPA: transglutaminase domain-containing protein, partial [Chloroflexota bacterium]|nr:transglutaminase domain-containing protein [Chloroflexota bacterium]